MFKKKTDYVSELLETLLFAFKEKVENGEFFADGYSYKITKVQCIEILFHVKEKKYQEYLSECNEILKKESDKENNQEPDKENNQEPDKENNQETKNSDVVKKITNHLKRIHFNNRELEIKKVHINYEQKVKKEFDSKKLIETVKDILEDYKNDFGYNEENLRNIKQLTDIGEIYKYIFGFAYDDNEKMLVINPNLGNLNKVLFPSLKRWGKMNRVIKFDSIVSLKCGKNFLGYSIEYVFINDNQLNRYTLNLYVYTGINLNEDLKEEKKNNNEFLNETAVSLICVFNPYYNWIASENTEIINSQTYIRAIKENNISHKYIKDYIIIRDLKDELLLHNQLSQAIIKKVENFNEIILKRHLYKNMEDFKDKLINERLLNLESKLIDMNADNSNTSNLKKNLLLVGEYSIHTIIKYAEKYSNKSSKKYLNIDIFSNSKTYVDSILDVWKRIYSANYPNVNLKSMRFYLGIADSVIASKRKYYDFIVVGNGNGSFLTKLTKYFTYFNFILKDGGTFLFSVYNTSFSIDGISSENLNKNLLFVLKDDKINYRLEESNAEMTLSYSEYTNKDIKHKLERFFDVKKEISYPMLALNNVSSHEMSDELKLAMDEAFIMRECQESSYNYNGYFMMFLCQKVSSNADQNNEDVNNANLLKEGINQFEHKPIFNKTVQMNYLKNAINITEKNVLKVILLKNIQNDNFAILVTFYGKFLPKGEETHTISNQQYKLLSIKEINELNLEVGNISPFVLLESDSIDRYYDKKLDLYDRRNLNKPDDSKMKVYFGSNHCDITYYMVVNKFVKLLKQNKFKAVIV